jgi:hypothetical protein
MKFEYLLFGDKYFVVIVLKLLRHSGRAGLGFVAGNKNIFCVKSDRITLRLIMSFGICMLGFNPLT